MLIMPYDTDSQSRNVLASPLGEEGHEVAKGCTRVRMIMILDVDVTAERRHYNTHRPQGRYHNPRPEGPSNLRTLRPIGPVHLKNPFYATLLYNPWRQPRPFFKNLRRSRHHNPRPERPSNLRTLRPIGPVHLKNPPNHNLQTIQSINTKVFDTL